MKLFIQALSFLTVFGLAGPTVAQSFKDNDWTTAVFANCGLPNSKGGVPVVEWSRTGQDRKLSFTLQKGQVGTCFTDATARHSAPYWERAEVRQDGNLRLDAVNTISFEATFQSGFQGKRESFFQIHNWGQSCDAYPPLMLKFHRGALQVMALRGVKSTAQRVMRQGRHRNVVSNDFQVADHYGKPIRFRIVFETKEQGQGTMSLFANDIQLVKDARLDFAICAKPHIKFGIYRPGGTSDTSQVAFDDLVIASH